MFVVNGLVAIVVYNVTSRIISYVVDLISKQFLLDHPCKRVLVRKSISFSRLYLPKRPSYDCAARWHGFILANPIDALAFSDTPTDKLAKLGCIV
jgi:hypothetical protein